MQLDDNLKQLMKELGAAINDALSESEDISEAIQNVRNAGYDVFLVLEATIGFNKRAKGEGSEDAHRKGQDDGQRIAQQPLEQYSGYRQCHAY